MKLANKREAVGAAVLGAGALFVLVIGPLLFFVCLTMFRLAGAPEDNTGLTSIGEASAVLKMCDRKGPISSEGLGYFWECEADVTVNGHSVGVMRFDPDELTPADGASPVGVNRSGDHWQRDVAHPYRLLHAAGLVVLVIDFFAMLVALIPVLTLILWLLTRLRKPQGHDDEVAQPSERRVFIRFRAPAKPKRRSPTGATVLGFGGLFLLVVGGWMLYIHSRLSADLWGGAAAATIILFGLVSLIATIWWAFAPEKRGDLRTIELTEAGIKQDSDSEESTLPWEALRSVVFDERGQPGRISAHLALVDESSTAKLLKEYRRPSKHGVLLTPEITLEQAELAAESIRGFRPGLVHWRSRELARRGFGPDKNPGPATVRWKDGAATTRSAAVDEVKAGETVRVRTGRMPGSRFLSFVGLYLLIVLMFALRQFDDFVPVWVAPVAALLTFAWGVLLYRTRFRGTPGVFELDDDSLTWFERDTPPRHVVPAEIQPIDLPFTSLQQIQLERSKSEHGRQYVSVTVRRDGIQSVLAKRITTAAASRLAVALASRKGLADRVRLVSGNDG